MGVLTEADEMALECCVNPLRIIVALARSCGR